MTDQWTPGVWVDGLSLDHENASMIQRSLGKSATGEHLRSATEALALFTSEIRNRAERYPQPRLRRDENASLNAIAHHSTELRALLGSLSISAYERIEEQFAEPRTYLVAFDELAAILDRLAVAARPERGSPPKEPERELIYSLAEVWRSVHGQWPRRSFDAYADAESGRFRGFVQACLAALPAEMRPSGNLDGVIRAVCNMERKRDPT